jgi:hypothetical protein
MLTNTLLLYMTQEALAKARARLTVRKNDRPAKDAAHAVPDQAVWQVVRQQSAKLRVPLRH